MKLVAQSKREVTEQTFQFKLKNGKILTYTQYFDASGEYITGSAEYDESITEAMWKAIFNKVDELSDY